MNSSTESHNLHQIHHVFESSCPQLTFFGGRYIKNGEKLSDLTKKVDQCAQMWKQLNCEDRLIGLKLQRSIRDFHMQIDRDLPKYNLLTRFFAYLRMFELSFVHFHPRVGKYIFPEFHNTIDLFKKSLDWRSQSNFCVFTEDQLKESFPRLWAEWQRGDRSKINEKPDPFGKIYSLDPNFLFDELQNKKSDLRTGLISLESEEPRLTPK